MAKAKKVKRDEATFDCNMRELEQIVASLEQGEVELEKSLELYERGAKLIGACRKQLQQAEMRIEKMRIGPSGEVELEAFDEDGGEGAAAGAGEASSDDGESDEDE